MKTSTLTVLLGGAIILAAFAAMMNRCHEPSEMEVVMIQLNCAQSVDIESFITEACQKLRGEDACELMEEDRPVVERLFLDKVNACATKTLKDRNMCVDKYEAV